MLFFPHHSLSNIFLEYLQCPNHLPFDNLDSILQGIVRLNHLVPLHLVNSIDSIDLHVGLGLDILQTIDLFVHQSSNRNLLVCLQSHGCFLLILRKLLLYQQKALKSKPVKKQHLEVVFFSLLKFHNIAYKVYRKISTQ